MAFGSSAVVKVGTIQPYNGNAATAPDGWLLCDGSAISRTLYADLFNAIGTYYGGGDGSTTFNIPNCNNIVNSVNTNVPCKGNGKTLGLFDGINYTGLTQANSPAALYRATGYGGNIGASASLSYPTNFTLIGMTTDQANSGVVGTVTRGITGCKFLIKY